MKITKKIKTENGIEIGGCSLVLLESPQQIRFLIDFIS
jgi:hypothetical protein